MITCDIAMYRMNPEVTLWVIRLLTGPNSTHIFNQPKAIAGAPRQTPISTWCFSRHIAMADEIRINEKKY